MMLVAKEKPPFLSDKKSRQLSGTGMFSSCHVVDDVWLLEAGSMAGARLTWFKTEFGQLEEQAANSLGVSAYDVLGIEAETSKPGPNSPVFVVANDAIFNLTLEHKRGDMIRSILDGVAFEAQQILEAAENSGIQVRSITMVGGGAKSAIWRQIVADVTNRPVTSPELTEMGVFGAAILGGLGTRVYERLGDVPRPSGGSENTPNPEMHETYKALYKKYRRLYELSRT
jgi:xylulokinase